MFVYYIETNQLICAPNQFDLSLLQHFFKLLYKPTVNKDDLLTYSVTYYFAPHLSAYRASYSTEHVLLHLIEEWKTNFDNKFAVGMVLKLLTGHLTTF